MAIKYPAAVAASNMSHAGGREGAGRGGSKRRDHAQGDVVGRCPQGRKSSLQLGILKSELLLGGTAFGALGQVDRQGRLFLGRGQLAVHGGVYQHQGLRAVHQLLRNPANRSRSSARALVSRALIVAAEVPSCWARSR